MAFAMRPGHAKRLHDSTALTVLSGAGTRVHARKQDAAVPGPRRCSSPDAHSPGSLATSLSVG